MRQLVLALCGLTVLGWAPAASQNAAWKEYTFSQDGFAISAPAKVEFRKQTDKSNLGNLETHIYSIASGQQGVFVLLVFILPAKDQRVAQQILTDARESTLSKGKLIAEAPLTL